MATVPLLKSLEALKNTPRRGWVLRGVPDPESVSDHMYQMAMICLAYPWENEADRAKAVEMAIVHDAPECIVGDIAPADGISREIKYIREALAVKYLVCLAKAGGENGFADRIPALWNEYEAGESPVARFVHQVDHFEAMIQASIYTTRYPHLNLEDFRSKEGINDPWLSRMADDVLASWDTTKQSDTSGSFPILFVVGGPGVGKGTQCSLAARKFNLEHISVGELLRQEQGRPESVYSDFIRESFQHSITVPAELTMMLLHQELQHARKKGRDGVLLDGFPRSVEQLVAFQEQISRNYVTISMECQDSDLTHRLTSRSASSGREDDDPELITRRITSFKKSHEEVLQLLAKNPVRTINCAGTADEVQQLFHVEIGGILRPTPYNKTAPLE